MPSCLAVQQNHQWRHKVTLHEELQEDKSAALSPSSKEITACSGPPGAQRNTRPQQGHRVAVLLQEKEIH